MRTKKTKNVRIERFDNLSKNKGFGEVLHVKNVAKNDKKGNKIEAENANQFVFLVRIEKYYN